MDYRDNNFLTKEDIEILLNLAVYYGIIIWCIGVIAMFLGFK